jgi:Phage gp6-like head-tail connector protein
MLLTDLRELKSIMGIEPLNTQRDKRLLFLIEQATSWIEEYCDRSFTYATRTEIYKGTGCQKLNLRARPVYPAPSGNYGAINVVVDDCAYYGSSPNAFTGTPLTYGQCYCLEIDQADGGSRSGILIRINGYWCKPAVRQAGLLSPFIGEDWGSIQVTYTAGYTPDTIPATLREACNTLVMRMNHLIPIGIEIASEGYEERSISFAPPKNDYVIGGVKGRLNKFKNWTFAGG